MGQDFLVDLKLNLGSEYSGYEISERRKKNLQGVKMSKYRSKNVETSKSCLKKRDKIMLNCNGRWGR